MTILHRAFAAAFTLTLTSAAAAQDPKAIEHFEKKIRPVLVQHCYECHSSSLPKPKGGLVLDTREGLLKGGKSGPSIVAGKPGESLLIEALEHDTLKMPPTVKLPGAVIADFAYWVKVGAPDPRTGQDLAKKTESNDWIARKPASPKPPATKDAAWPRGDVDRFVLASLEAKGIAPNGDADRVTLIRRLSFDLIGLPPTPEEIDAFVGDTGKNAVEKLVDRLLASRHFGERWGRHWLDVAHFAENSGVVKYGQSYPHAWRYRDWVIDAFNSDKPYDQFVREQLAGDLLPAESPTARDRMVVGTGFLVMGRLRQGGLDLQAAMDNIDEQIDAVSQGFLGLTVSCARCHDHKFDPITIKDYYALAGIFKSTQVKLGGGGGGKNAAGKDNPKNKGAGNSIKLSGDELAMGVSEGPPSTCRVLYRGDVKNLGETMPRALPAIFAETTKGHAIAADASGRLQLANWIASADNPLTARVMVNRVWHHLFGRGLVPTVDNFGAMGEPCSHPELVDHLASTFVEQGWSVKKLIRTIVLSHAYQLSSEFSKASYEADAENMFLWRHSLRRLDAESIRDAMLSASGQLDPAPLKETIAVDSGPKGPKTGGKTPDHLHRSVYLPVVRENIHEMMQTFDFADPSLVFGRRDVTTVPTQALFLMNNPFVMSQSAQLAKRVTSSTTSDDLARVRLTFRLTLGRLPSAQEEERAAAFLREQGERGMAMFCQAMFQAAEFRYVR